jgi:hypothetical protein
MQHVMRYPGCPSVPAPPTAGADDGCKGAWRLLATHDMLHQHRLCAGRRAVGFLLAELARGGCCGVFEHNLMAGCGRALSG